MGISDEEVSGLCESLVRLRRAVGLTQSEWAKRLGVTQASVTKYENGGLDFPLRLLPKLSKAVGEPQDVVFLYLMRDRFDRIRSFDPALAEEFERLVERLDH